MIVYFSSVTNNTQRFVEKLGLPSLRLPISTSEASHVMIDSEFVLVVPTYGAGSKGFVPKQVIKFLNNPVNRKLIRGVIATGNTNFGEDYGMAGKIVSAKCNVPLLYTLELMGLDEDIRNVKEGLSIFWESQK